LDDQIWLLINSGCQLDVSAQVSVPEREKLVKAVVAALKKSRGVQSYSPEELLKSGALGTAKLRG